MAIARQDGDFAAVAGIVKDLDGTDYARIRLEEYVAGAKDALGVLHDSQAKEFLLQLADYCAYRQI